MMWGDHYFAGWWMLFGGIGTVLFWGAVIWVIFMVARSFSHDSRELSHRKIDDAEEIARRRFAAGEISEDEYRQIVDTLHR